MTEHEGGVSINHNPAWDTERDEVGEEAGTVREKGEDPSPADRGKASPAENAAAIDLDTARDRAS